MAFLHEGLERMVDESMPFLFDKLGDLSQLINHRCFTLGQCSVLLCMHNNTEKPDRSEDAASFVMLAFHDVSKGKLQVLHPETLLPWSEYLEMIKAGMYDEDNPLSAPMVTAGWLVRVEEAVRWWESKGLPIDLSEVLSDLDKLEKSNAIENQGDCNPLSEESKFNSLNSDSNNEEIPSKLFDEDQYKIFDPLRKEQIKGLFPLVSEDRWKNYFERAARNGLSDARQTPKAKNQYNPARVAEWLFDRGHYQRNHLVRILAKNLPKRSVEHRESFLDSYGILDKE